MSLVTDIENLSLEQIQYIHGSGTDIVITQTGNPTLNQGEIDAADDVVTALELLTDSEINSLEGVGPGKQPRRRR